jgi:hypothetical protein
MTLSPGTVSTALFAIDHCRGILRESSCLAAMAELELVAAARHPVIQFIAHPTDDCLWRFSPDGPWLHYATARRSRIPWAFYNLMRDGQTDASAIATPGALRKGKAKFTRWLTRIGSPLADEIDLRISIGRDGTMRYTPGRYSPRIAFD